jgi:outer membrane protein assembly factor BamB
MVRGARSWVATIVVLSMALPGCVGPTARSSRVAGQGAPDEARPAAAVVGATPLARAPDLSVGDDVLDAVRRQNSAAYAPPPTTFRPGSVTPGSLPGAAIQRSPEGFRVQLPSGAPVTTPTVYGDLVVVSGGFRSRDMYAFRAGDGALVWAIGISDDGPSTAACEDEVCVFNTESCTLFAVDAGTGALRWAWYLGDPLMSAPTVAGGLVFAAYPTAGAVGSAGVDLPAPDGVTHGLAAFDLRTGELRWARWIDADVISAPVAILDSVYVATYAGTLYRIDQRTGEITGARRSWATSAPTLVDGALYFAHRADGGPDAATPSSAAGRGAQESIVRSEKGGDKEGGGQAAPAAESAPMAAPYLEHEFQGGTVHGQMSQELDAANGFSDGAPASANAGAARRLIGRESVYGLQEYQGSWVLGRADANYAAMGDSLVCIDRQSGGPRWSVRLPGELSQLGGALAPPPVDAGDRLVVATLAGEVLLVDPASGAVDRRFQVGAPVRSQPAVDRGWVYVGTATGQLVGIRTGDPSLTGWPTWAANPARTGVRQLAVTRP